MSDPGAIVDPAGGLVVTVMVTGPVGVGGGTGEGGGGGGGALTAKIKLVVLGTPLFVPVTVIVWLPVGVELVVLILRDTKQSITQLAELNVPVAPEGTPETEKEALCGKGPDMRSAVMLFSTADP